jgi:calcineurin-like phosphoesterase family protein
MDEAIIGNWNKTITSKDKVYVLGDVVINRKALKTLGRLNGEKVLIKGNHDLFRLEEYTPYFKDIRGFGVLDGMALTHVPIHPNSLSRWTCNVHGHLHSNKVMKARWYRDEEGEWNTTNDIEDLRYFCICVEQINYTPISLEELKKRIKERQECAQ